MEPQSGVIVMSASAGNSASRFQLPGASGGPIQTAVESLRPHSGDGGPGIAAPVLQLLVQRVNEAHDIRIGSFVAVAQAWPEESAAKRGFRRCAVVDDDIARAEDPRRAAIA